MKLKNIQRGRVSQYTEQYPDATFIPVDPELDYNPLWNHKAACAFPSATQNEINEKDAQHLVDNGISVVSEGANMPTTPDGVNIFLDRGILYGPGKAANAGGVSVSGLEMSQNSMRLNWPREEVDKRLKGIMKNIHRMCMETAAVLRSPRQLCGGRQYRRFRQGCGFDDRSGSCVRAGRHGVPAHYGALRKCRQSTDCRR